MSHQNCVKTKNGHEVRLECSFQILYTPTKCKTFDGEFDFEVDFYWTQDSLWDVSISCPFFRFFLFSYGNNWSEAIVRVFWGRKVLGCGTPSNPLYPIRWTCQCIGCKIRVASTFHMLHTTIWTNAFFVCTKWCFWRRSRCFQQQQQQTRSFFEPAHSAPKAPVRIKNMLFSKRRLRRRRCRFCEQTDRFLQQKQFENQSYPLISNANSLPPSHRSHWSRTERAPTKVL